MKHLAAYLLLHLENPFPTKEDVIALLATVDIQPDLERLDDLFERLEGWDVQDVMQI